ncbi:MAG TPA: enoyl-CoA hydratase-related protein [Miltoncostaeaceae bacterium]|nr:enoyl-CoA hydratase-related protein [Miltoncostaeaceae bacterium]
MSDQPSGPTRAYEDLLVARGAGRVTITINRPERLNALRTQTLIELCAAFEDAILDDGVGVIVLAGAGDTAFCVGGDVRDPTRTATEKRRQGIYFMRLAESIRTCGKPVIVRVQGYCIGAGNEINVIADLTIAAESAVFGQAGTRLGWAPALWTCQILARSCGEKRAREVVYLSRRYPAHEAKRLGLANVVVPDDQLDAEVDRWCEQILRRSPEGLRLAKLGLNAGSDFGRQSILHSGEMHHLTFLFGPEPKEGMGAFAERRPADWRRFRRGQGPEPADD